MLSKVLARTSTAGVQPMVFASVGREGIERRGGELPPMPPTSEESAGLHERIRQLEARLATERREAFESGKLEGAKQVRAELDAVVARLNASIADIVAMRPELRRQAERDAVHLALLIAKRVLHRQLNVDEGALTAIARVAFDRLARSESYRITVHPQFAAAITAALPANQSSRIHIEPDPSCAAGTLIIHSDEGTLDASVDTQLEEIRRGLTDRIEARG
jgi:flagellar assembly protein FliH